MLIVILLFNVFDTVGRYSGGLKVFPPRVVIFLAILRTFFIITTVGVALDWAPTSIFGSDAFKVANLVVFSISNGFVSTQCAIIAPSCVKEDQKEQVGIFVGLFIALGIVMGSLVAIFMAKVFE